MDFDKWMGGIDGSRIKKMLDRETAYRHCADLIRKAFVTDAPDEAILTAIDSAFKNGALDALYIKGDGNNLEGFCMIEEYLLERYTFTPTGNALVWNGPEMESHYGKLKYERLFSQLLTPEYMEYLNEKGHSLLQAVLEIAYMLGADQFHKIQDFYEKKNYIEMKEISETLGIKEETDEEFFRRVFGNDFKVD